MRYLILMYSILVAAMAARAEEQLDALPELAPVEAPHMEGTLRGAQDSRPPTRTAESFSLEVKENQSKLSYLYKSWSVRGIDGIGGRHYGLALTISPDGEVLKAVFKGPVNKDFLKEAEAIVKTWSFSRVQAQRPFVANMKNLDFLYRRELVVD